MELKQLYWTFLRISDTDGPIVAQCNVRRFCRDKYISLGEKLLSSIKWLRVNTPWRSPNGWFLKQQVIYSIMVLNSKGVRFWLAKILTQTSIVISMCP